MLNKNKRELILAYIMSNYKSAKKLKIALLNHIINLEVQK